MIKALLAATDARGLRHGGARVRPRADLRLLPDPALLRARGLVGAAGRGSSIPRRSRSMAPSRRPGGSRNERRPDASRSPSTSSPTSSAPGASSASGGWRRRSRSRTPVSIRWRPFQLDATIPPEGKDRRAYMEAKFGSLENDRSRSMRTSPSSEPQHGIPFAFDRIKVSPNTLDAHRLIRWAGRSGTPGRGRRGAVPRLFHRGPQHRRPRCAGGYRRRGWNGSARPPRRASRRTRIARRSARTSWPRSGSASPAFRPLSSPAATGWSARSRPRRSPRPCR